MAEYSRNLLDALTPGPGLAAITVLCDARTEASWGNEGPEANGRTAATLRARPAWRLGGGPDGMAELAEAIAREDAHVVVIQHSPV